MIILVEDDADQRLALKLALEQAGYSVREAPDGRQALALQRERPARFLITDIFMPEADGFELIHHVRREFPQTKIIVISGGGRRVKQDYVASAELARELQDFVRSKIAEYKRPRWIEFVDALPKTATGKTQRFKLRESAASEPVA